MNNLFIFISIFVFVFFIIGFIVSVSYILDYIFNDLLATKAEFPSFMPTNTDEHIRRYDESHPRKKVIKIFKKHELNNLIDEIKSRDKDNEILEKIIEYCARNTYMISPVKFLQVNGVDYIFEFNLFDINEDELDKYCITEYKYLYEELRK